MRIAAAVIGVVGALLAGMWLGGHSSVLPDPLQDLVADEQVAQIDDALSRVESDFYREVDEEKLTDDAIRGAVKGLDDRFSAYFDEKDYQRFTELTNARFSGIGVTVLPHDKGLQITQVYDKSPAAKAGLREDDVIVAADGKRLAGKPQEAATGLIKGPKGTPVRLTIERDGKRITKRVVRDEISVPVVSSRRRTVDGEEYAVIRLETFSSGAHAEFYEAVRKAEKDDVAGIVFDLRGNTGGLVTEARLIASAFLKEGEIVTTRGRSVEEQVYRATGEPVAPETPVVVLVDRHSASASEIVAGALQDRGRAKLVGTRTFGKGVFQNVVQLDNGGALDITVGQYFLPSGRNLGGKGTSRGAGLKPDVRARDDRKTERRDEALQRALDVLAG
ncbi:MAG TPA: S41 family peptidase [Solirubrobacteraceae bacterium]|nr:S41 family peptidase [Solirubrobacteraceae bacterium]